MGELSEASPARRWFMLRTSASDTPSVLAIFSVWSCFRSPCFQRLHLALQLAQVEEQALLAGCGAHLHEAPRAQDVFLNFDALIHHMAYVARRNPLSGSNFLTACIRPTLPSEMTSATGRP